MTLEDEKNHIVNSLLKQELEKSNHKRETMQRREQWRKATVKKENHERKIFSQSPDIWTS